MCHLRVRPAVPALAGTAGPGHAGVVSDQAGLFRIRFRADPVELALFRAGLNRWLLGLGWPATDRQDAVLAINEACDNSVRQACWGDPGEVEVVARLVIGVDGRRIVAVVRDQSGSPGGGGADGTGVACYPTHALSGASWRPTSCGSACGRQGPLPLRSRAGS